MTYYPMRINGFQVGYAEESSFEISTNANQFYNGLTEGSDANEIPAVLEELWERLTEQYEANLIRVRIMEDMALNMGFHKFEMNRGRGFDVFPLWFKKVFTRGTNKRNYLNFVYKWKLDKLLVWEIELDLPFTFGCKCGCR